MYLNRRPNTLSVRAALLAAVILSTALIAPISTHAQTSTFSGPACTATTSPETDTWPVAGTDSLSTVAGAPVTFTAAALLANDSNGTTPLSVAAVGPTSTNGATITGAGPYTYTAAPGFSGTDYFTYILADASTPARTTAGIVHVSVGRDLTPPTVSLTAPASGATISSNTVVRASAADNVGVAGVSFFDGATPIGAEVTVAPYQVTWDITSVADGAHSLTAVARDASGNSATSAAVNVSVTHAPPPPPVVTPAVDKMVFSEGASTAGRRTTAAFSTSTAGEVLVAFAASDGPAASNAESLTVSGAGLTWTRVQRAATRFGTAEIWTASAPSVLTNVTVSSVQSSPNFHQSLTVIAFTGVAGVGASNVGGGVGATSVSLVAQAAGSVVYGVGNDWDRAVARSIPAGQTKVHEFVDTAVGDTFWVQALGGATSSAGASVALSTTAPTTDQWNFAAVELKPAAASTPPVMVTVPNVVNQTQATAQSMIAAAGLTVGTVSNVNNAAAAGTVIGQNPIGGTSAASGSAVALTVSSGPAPTGAGPTVDATAYSEGTGNRTTPAFSTSGAGVLVAFATADGNPTANGQTLTVSGAGLTWTRVQRAASQMGDAEIWTASSASALTNVTVTSTQSVTSVGGAAVNQLLYVVAFTGASGVGASNVGGAPTGAPSISLVAQAAGSVVYAVGNDYDQGIPRTVPAGQTKVHEFVAPSGDTFWVQSLNAATSAAGATAAINDTAPTTDQWNYAIVEIKR